MGSYALGSGGGVSVAGVAKTLDKLSMDGFSFSRDKRCDLEGGPWWMTSAPNVVS